MRLDSVDRVINFDNGDSFKIGEKVRLKEVNKDEIIVIIDGISPIFNRVATMFFYTEERKWFFLEIENIECIEHI